MAGPVAMPFFELLKTTWVEGGLRGQIKGGFFNGDPPTDLNGPAGQVKRPYLVVSKVAEAPTGFSNQTQYDRLEFEIAIMADTDTELGGVLMPAVETITKTIPPEATLSGGSKVKNIRPGAVRYEESLQYWIGTQTWVVRTAKQR